MSRRKQKATDQLVPSEPAPVSLSLQADNEPEPVATRTRSGRRIGAPVALPDLQLPSRKGKRNVKDPYTAGQDGAEPPGNCSAETERKPEVEPEIKRRKEAENRTPEPPLPQSAIPSGGEKENRTGGQGKPARSIPLGRPKSGRVWKDRNKQRFSAMLRDKPLCTSWEKKMEAKREKQLMKQYSQQLKDAKTREKEEKRKRRQENLKRREENERKAEIVQVIRNPAKMKRMKKKQLRRIEKRDTLALLQGAPMQGQNKVGKKGRH